MNTSTYNIRIENEKFGKLVNLSEITIIKMCNHIEEIMHQSQTEIEFID